LRARASTIHRRLERTVMLLIVNESTSFLQALAHLLGTTRHVLTATSSTRALGLVTANEIRAVVADLDLDPGGKDAVWLLSEIARRAPRARRVLLTYKPDHRAAFALRRGDIHHVLEKPVTVGDLQAAVEDDRAKPISRQVA
jgi:DNA-binding NtrC family response regulator